MSPTMLAKYFETQVGKKITKNIVTGEKFFTEVYERVYKIEVIGIEKGKLYAQVDSYDKVPSGYKQGGSDADLGEITINLREFKSREEVIAAIIKRSDSSFIHRYKIKAI